MERRTKEGYKLRIYMDAIKACKAMTDEQWVDQWAASDSRDRYQSRKMWLSYLESCALVEAEKMARKEVA